jgi:Putative amidase domain
LSDPGEVRDGITPKYIKQHELMFTTVGGKEKIKLKAHRLINDPEEPSPEAIKNAVPAPPNAVPAIVDYGTPSALSFQLPTTLAQVPVILPNFFSGINTANLDQTLEKTLEHKAFNLGFSSESSYPSESIAQLMLYQSQSIAQLRTVYYDRAGTYAYASKWWNSFNPNYRNYGDADCTNYASQILSDGGGWPTILDNQATNPAYTWWYSSSGGQSRSWTWAPAMYDFLSKYPARATPVDRTSKLNMGDIVQVDWGKGEGLSHTMVVTKRRADGMIYLTGHSIPHFELPVYDIVARFPSAKLFTWKLADSFKY